MLFRTEDWKVEGVAKVGEVEVGVVAGRVVVEVAVVRGRERKRKRRERCIGGCEMGEDGRRIWMGFCGFLGS